MKKNNGFVLVELIVVMGIVLLLSGFVIFSLINTKKNVSVDSSADAIISDIKSQQTKAMQGIGEQSGQAYGVYIDSEEYILFDGTSYSPSDPSNFTVALEPGIIITNITFPASSIIFSSKSGEINAFSNGNSSFTLEDVSATKSITVTLNKYGIVVSQD